MQFIVDRPIVISFQNEVQKLFKQKFNFTQDMEFVTQPSVDPIDVHSFEYEDSPNPDINASIFDLRAGPTSAWNAAVIESLLKELQDCCVEEEWPICRSAEYIRSLLIDCYKRLWTIWRKAQPWLTDTGELETPAETEARLREDWAVALKVSRQTTCRHNVGS